MSDLPQDPEQSLRDDELAFGAQIMCKAFYRREISEEQQGRFVELYGTAGRLFLHSAKWPLSLLAATELLVMAVPELRQPFIEQSTIELAQSLCISTSTGGALQRLVELMHERPESFDRLKAERAARRRRLVSGFETKRFLGRNDVHINRRKVPWQTGDIELKNRSNED